MSKPWVVRSTRFELADDWNEVGVRSRLWLGNYVDSVAGMSARTLVRTGILQYSVLHDQYYINLKQAYNAGDFRWIRIQHPPK